MVTEALGRVLIVDDEVGLVGILVECLAERRYLPTGCTSAEEALALLADGKEFDIVITDVAMPGMDGITMLRRVRELDADTVGIVMTGHGTIETAVQAMREGAFEYVLKPFKATDLLPTLSRALEVRRLRMENVQLRETVGIYELSMAIALSLDPLMILNKAADAALQHCRADEASVLLPLEGKDGYFVAVARGENRHHILGVHVPEDGVAAWVGRNLEPLVLRGSPDDPRFKSTPRHPPIHASVSMPMVAGGSLVGVLNVNLVRSRRTISLGLVKGLSILANIAAAAIENARLHRKLEGAEANYRSIFENSIEGIFRTTPDGRYLAANPALARMCGYASPQELIASVTDLAKQFYVDLDRRTEFVRLMEEQGMVTDFVSLAWTREGKQIWISENARAIRDDAGVLRYYEGTTVDITARIESERAQLESERRSRVILDTAYDAFISMDAQGRIIGWNRQAEATFGWKSDEVLGHSLADTIVPLSFRESHERGLRRFLETGEGALLNQRIEVTALHRDGHEFPVEVTIWPVESDGVFVFNAFLHDITSRRASEAALRESNARLEEALGDLRRAQSKIIEQERLRALGTMASGVAHDFNNALSPILGFSELLLSNPQKLADPDRVRNYLQNINTAAKDAAGVVARLREFYRQRDEDEVLLPVDQNAMVEQAVSLTQPKWKDEARAKGVTVDVHMNLGPSVVVPGGAAELREALINLILNAVDAMPEGGTLTLRTREETERAVIEIIDTGCGMSPEIRDRCFDPFFTTKGEHGTGLGLAMVHGIVQRHEGTIEVNTEPGKGTSFTIRLPRYVEGSTPPTTEPTPRPQRSLNILVVDDEPLLREVIAEHLMGDGHTVEIAANGREALGKFLPGRYDAVITDRAMPEMSGDQLAAAIKEASPETPVILLTGFGRLMIDQGEMPAGVDLILSKPPSARDLREALGKVMTGQAQ